jgi:hypothetical protein
MHGEIGNLGIKTGDSQQPLSPKQTKRKKGRKNDLEEKMGQIQELCIQEGYNKERKKEKIHLHHDGIKDVSKRKYFGAKNPECSG